MVHEGLNPGATRSMEEFTYDEFAQFLKLAEASGGDNFLHGMGGSRKEPTLWSNYYIKAGISASIFCASILAFRNFGEALL